MLRNSALTTAKGETMKPTATARALTLAALCATAFAGSAAASDVEGMRAKFREMDSNGDRALQFSEIEAARAALFDRMDINGNGLLDPDEVDVIRKAAQANRAESGGAGLFGQVDIAERAAVIDANGDGIISRAEFAGYLPERLKAADRNGDRTLSLKELRSLKRG